MITQLLHSNAGGMLLGVAIALCYCALLWWWFR